MLKSEVFTLRFNYFRYLNKCPTARRSILPRWVQGGTTTTSPSTSAASPPPVGGTIPATAPMTVPPPSARTRGPRRSVGHGRGLRAVTPQENQLFFRRLLRMTPRSYPQESQVGWLRTRDFSACYANNPFSRKNRRYWFCIPTYIWIHNISRKIVGLDSDSTKNWSTEYVINLEWGYEFIAYLVRLLINEIYHCCR